MNRSRRTTPARGARILPPPSADWAYFFDVDGTLAEISSTPVDARIERDLHDLVVALVRATGGAVALISGRAIDDIDRMFPAVRMPASGQHGAEWRDSSGRRSRQNASSSRLDDARHALADAVARHPGLLLEDKGLSLALHYRQAPHLAGYAHRLLRKALARAGSGYAMLAGKRVVEMKPAGNSKGASIAAFMRDEPFRGRVPVFVGDDVTDESGFAVINRLDGYSVKVGGGPTVARWRLPSVQAVQRWLAQAPQASARAMNRNPTVRP